MQIPDLSNIPELKPVEPGTYTIRIKKAKDTKASTGTQGIMLICDIVDVDDAETLFHTLWISENSLRMTKDFIVALGLDPADTSTEDFEGIEFEALLDIDTFEGRTKNILVRAIAN